MLKMITNKISTKKIIILVSLVIGFVLIGRPESNGEKYFDHIKSTIKHELNLQKNLEDRLLQFFEEKEYEGDNKRYGKWIHAIRYDLGIVGNDTATLWFLKLLRNEIYARRGYIFKSPELKEFFSQMSWYKPVSTEVPLNEIEQRNVAFILSEEEWYKEMKEKENELPKSQVNIEMIDTLPEIYEKEVLIKGTFFNNGTFAPEQNPPPTAFAFTMWEGDVEFPSCFVVDKKGRFAYLLDVFNNRLQVFDIEEKKLISSVQGNFFRRATEKEIETSKKWNPVGLDFAAIDIINMYFSEKGDLCLGGFSVSIDGDALIRMPLLYRYDIKTHWLTDESRLVYDNKNFEKELRSQVLKNFPQVVKLTKNGLEYCIKLVNNDGNDLSFNVSKDTIFIKVPNLSAEAGLITDAKGVITVLNPILKEAINPNTYCEIFRFEPITQRILSKIKVGDLFFVLGSCQIDENGNIFYWERIPKPGHEYELDYTVKWQVVCLKIKARR